MWLDWSFRVAQLGILEELYWLGVVGHHSESTGDVNCCVNFRLLLLTKSGDMLLIFQPRIGGHELVEQFNILVIWGDVVLAQNALFLRLLVRVLHPDWQILRIIISFLHDLVEHLLILIVNGLRMGGIRRFHSPPALRSY